MDRPIVTVKEGKIQGVTLTSILGFEYFGFRGIPYAQPPLGDLRFREPRPPLAWSGIRDASSFAGEIAIQYETVGQPPFAIIGSEDCLYLNVYANKIDRNRPVLVYIHGGSFVEGNGSVSLREDYFVSLDLVLVYINYRLGPLGFLNLGHEVAPGNQGFRDIIFALEWVKTNIAAFGGDPNNITVFGNSAGSVACHILAMLPTTKNLFHKAILQSGSINLVQRLLKGTDLKNGFKIASLLGMDSEDPEQVVEFLRSVPAEKLVALEGQILSEKDLASGQTEYHPVVDADFARDPIIPVPLRDLQKNIADVPLLLGQTKDECLILFMGKFQDDELFEYYDEILEYMLENYFLEVEDADEFFEIAKFTREYYFNNNKINVDEKFNLIRLLNDTILNANRRIIDLRIKNGTAPVYFYNFTYMGEEPTFFTFDRGPQPVRGVSHGDELSYMFNIDYMKKDKAYKRPEEGSKDWLMTKRLTKMWYNFAATGNPTPDPDDPDLPVTWKPVSKETIYCLDIGDELVLKDDKTSESRKYYEKVKDFLTVRIDEK